jgi:hypothetical protein
MPEKIAVKNYLVSYLSSPESTRQDKQVVKMMILLLAKIAKLAWFDDADIKNGLVPDLSKILMSNSNEHRLVGLEAIDQLVVEMTYMTKMKNLTLNRRVSLSFRDSALYEIFKNNLHFTKTLLEQLNNEFGQNSMQVIIDSLAICLETYLKCMQFDFVAILLNETLDEPSQTNVPAAWVPLI